MKQHRLFRLAVLPMAILALSAPPSRAGENVIEPLEDPLGLEASIGYDMRYYARGFWFANHSVWTSVAYSKPLTEKLSLDLFSYYVQAWTPTDYNEVDAGVYMTYDAGFTTLTFGYTWYHFLNGFFGDDQGPQDWAHEVGLASVTPIGPVNFNLAYYYDLYIAANYFQAGLDTEIPVTDAISIVPSAVLGYNVGDYYSLGTAGTGFNHIGLRIDFPIALSEMATLTPYVAGNFSLQGKEGVNTIEGKNEAWGGIAFTLAF